MTAPKLALTITGIASGNVTAAEKVRDFARNTGLRAGLVLSTQAGERRLKDDAPALEFIHDSVARGHEVLLGGLGPLGSKPSAGEFHRLGRHESALRINAATRQLGALGLEPTVFTPSRWLASPQAFEAARSAGFSVAADAYFVMDLHQGQTLPTRVFAFGDGFGAAKWWRRSLMNSVARAARKQQDIRLSISANKAMQAATAGDLRRIIDSLRAEGYEPSDYQGLVQHRHARVA